MTSLEKWLNKNGYKFETKQMVGGYKGIFIQLEAIENYTIVGRVNINKLMKYITRYGFNSEYRGHYTSLLVWK